jgi:hypothetical protein
MRNIGCTKRQDGHWSLIQSLRDRAIDENASPVLLLISIQYFSNISTARKPRHR